MIVAIDTTTPPYGMVDANMQPTGFDIEVANLMGKALGVPVEFVTVTSPGRIPALLTNRVDMVISIFSITPERALQVAFSIPYAGQSSVVIAPKSVAIKGPEDLVGQKVGVTRGTGEDGLLTAQAEKTPGIEILRFDDYSSIIAGDAVGPDRRHGRRRLRRNVPEEERQAARTSSRSTSSRASTSASASRKDNPELLQWLNTCLFTLKTDGTLDDAVDEVPQRAAARAAGVLIGSAVRRGASRPAPLDRSVTGCPWKTPCTSARC